MSPPEFLPNQGKAKLELKTAKKPMAKAKHAGRDSNANIGPLQYTSV